MQNLAAVSPELKQWTGKSRSIVKGLQANVEFFDHLV